MDQDYQKLISRLKRAYYRHIGLEMARRFLVVLSVLFLWLLGLAVLEWIMNLTGDVRKGILTASGLLVLGGLLWVLVFPWFNQPFHPEWMARKIGLAFDSIQDRLLNAVQLFTSADSTNAFTREELKSLSELCRPLDFNRAISPQFLKNYLLLFGSLCLVSTLIFFSFQEPLQAAMVRLWRADKNFVVKPAYRLESLSGQQTVVKRQPVSLGFQLSTSLQDSSLPLRVKQAQVRLFDEQDFLQQEITVYPDSSGRFFHTVSSVRESGFYNARVIMEDRTEVISLKFPIKVLEPGSLEWFQVKVYPPAYSGLSKQLLEKNVGDVSVLKGTKLTINGQINRPLPTFSIVFNDSLKKTLTSEAREFQTSFRVYKPMAYQFRIEDTLAELSKTSPQYDLSILRDSPPELEMLSPTSLSIDLPRSLILTVEGLVSDDYGISSIKLWHRLAHSEFGKAQDSYQAISIPKQKPSGSDKMSGAAQIRFLYNWSLADRLLTAGDKFEFYIEVLDNDNISGPKSTRSGVFTLSFPALDELFARAETNEKEMLEAFENQKKKAKKIQDELRELDSRLKQTSKTNWQEKKQLKDIQEKQQKALDEAQALAEKLEQFKRVMEENQLATKETLDKYQEIQQLLDQLGNSEFIKAREQLNKALSRLNEADIRKALENMDQAQLNLNESLDRTLKLLKRMKIDRQLDELLQRATDMIDKQRQVQKETRKLSGDSPQEQSGRLIQNQDQIQEMHQHYQRSLEKLSKAFEDYDEPERMPQSDLDLLNQKQKQQNLTKDLDALKNQLQNNAPQQAAQSQQQVLQKMLSQRSMIQKMKTKASMLDMAFLVAYLKKLVHEALELSVRQESLLSRVEQQPHRLSSDSLQFQLSKDQTELKELLQHLESKTKAIGNQSAQLEQQLIQLTRLAGLHMEKSVSLIRAGYRLNITREMTQSMTKLNVYADRLSGILGKLMLQKPKPGQGGGSSQQDKLRQMASEQGQLNKETMGMQAGQAMPTPERLDQMAARQRLLQKQLRELQARAAQEGQGGQKALGDLNRMAEDMARSAQSLQQNQLNPELVERQQRILSRLLDAAMAIQKEGFQKEREATAARDIQTPGAPNSLMEEEKSRVRQAMETFNFNDFNEDFREIIRNYYKKIEKQLN